VARLRLEVDVVTQLLEVGPIGERGCADQGEDALELLKLGLGTGAEEGVNTSTTNGDENTRREVNSTLPEHSLSRLLVRVLTTSVSSRTSRP
jgi:hypothetical protein